LISDNGMHVRFRCAIKATHLRGHDKGAKLDDVLGKRRHGPLRQSVLPIRSLTQAGEAESSTRRGQVRAGSASFDVCNTVPSAASAQTCFRSLKRRIPCNASRHGCGGQLYATRSACGLGLAALVSHGLRVVFLCTFIRVRTGHSNTVGTHRGVALHTHPPPDLMTALHPSP
jgi:hypothetical protein